MKYRTYLVQCTVYSVQCTVYSRLLHPQQVDGIWTGQTLYSLTYNTELKLRILEQKCDLYQQYKNYLLVKGLYSIQCT